MTQANSAFKKFYVDTSIGQVHGRMHGQGEVVVLLHWTPLSSQMFRHLMPLMASAGLQTVALDLPGYGRSDPRPEDWSMNNYAHIVAEALRALNIGRVEAVLGGHNGASVALELALEYPEIVEQLILDGVPFLSAELRQVLQDMANAQRPKPSEIDNIAQFPFDRALSVLKEYMPDFAVNDETIDQVWEYMIDYLEIDFVSSGTIAGNYDASQRLSAVTQPTLVLGAETDSMSGSFELARELLPHSKSHFFQGDNPIYVPDQTYRYAEQVVAFLNHEESY